MPEKTLIRYVPECPDNNFQHTFLCETGVPNMLC